MKDQKLVFKKFKDFIKKYEDNETPVYKSEEQNVRNYFDEPKEVELFWRNLWQAEDQGNPAAEWLEDMKEKMAEIVPIPFEDCLNVTTTECFKAVKKKKTGQLLDRTKLPTIGGKR